MTQDTQAGAGAQPAPAIQPESLSLTPAEVALTRILRIVQNYLPPDSDKSAHEALSDIIAEVDPWPLEMAPLRHLERQHAELSAARAEAKHWRTNHDNVVARLRIFTQRPDIPKELADRLPWYRELVRLQAVEAQALQQSAEITDAEIDRIAESMPGGLDGFLKAWGWRQFARAILQAAPPAPAAVAAVLQQAQRQAFIRGWDERGKAHDLAPAVTTDRFMRELLDVYFPPAAPAQEHATQLAGQALPADEFRGDTDSLVRNIVALLDLDAQGCLVPHGVGGHARGLLSAAASRLAASDQAQGCTRSHPHENMSPMCGLRTEIARLNHAAAIAQATAAPAQAQEDARDLEAEALRACRDLPEGWEIEIHLERGYGVVTVIDPQGNDDELPVEGTLFDALKETIDTAIRDDAARAAQGGAA